jgi:uncharacterized protein (DUF4415 family)
MSKKTKQQTKSAKSRKVVSLRAAADESKRSHDWNPDLYRPIKKPVTLRLDADVIAWFKTQGRGYQTRINRALRALMREKKA